MMGGRMQKSNKVRIGWEKGGECDGDAGNIHDGPWKSLDFSDGTSRDS